MGYFNGIETTLYAWKLSKVTIKVFFSYSFLATEFRLALVQFLVGADKAHNLTRTSKLIREAAANGA